MTSSKTPIRDTIYIDTEDEITAIVDKMKSANAKIVALVLPKRTTALQSAVNIKLLERAAKTAKKSLVLITSDSVVMSLAGGAGVYVAKTLQSKPEVPAVNIGEDEPTETVQSDDEVPEKTKSVGELAAADNETIEVNNETADKPDGAATATAAKSKFKAPKISIPNFDKFRKRLLIGGLILVVLVGGWIWASVTLPKAEITVKTNTTEVDTELQFTGKTDVNELNTEEKIVPIYKKEIKKSSSEKVKATGQRDDGTKAKGTMTLTNCIDDDQPHTIPAGTGFSKGDITFILNDSVTLQESIYTPGGECATDLGDDFEFSKTVGVTAIEGGEKYNVDAQSYTPPASYVTPNGDIRAYGSKMKGGTTNVVKIVTQGDIDGAKQAALDKLDPETTQALIDQFKAEQAIALKETFNKTEPTVKSEPAVGEKGEEATITIGLTYSQLGVKSEYLNLLIEASTTDKIDKSKQSIQKTGLEDAELTIVSKVSDDELKLKLVTKVVAGPQLDAESIKKEVAGQKKARTREIIQANPGIIDVEVEYSPFWVFTTPKNPNKISITFLKADGSQ